MREKKNYITNTIQEEKFFHKFSSHSTEYKGSVGQVYWKETDSIVSSKMNLPTKSRYRMISFVSNDYLGLSQHPQVRSAAIRAINLYGTLFCEAPGVGGYSSYQRQLEEGLSALLQTEDTLVFNSDFFASASLISTLAKPNDIVFIDSGVQRYIFEGINASVCKVIPHNDVKALENYLKLYKQEGINLFVVIDGVYSQDGDKGLAKEYLEISEKYDALLIVNDTHGVGIFGDNGGGVLEELNILGQVPLVIGSLSKAFGTIGGYISGRKKLIEYIRHYPNSCCFSVSLPPPCLAAALRALELIRRGETERDELLNKAQYARKKIQEAGFRITNSSSPIIGILTSTYEEATLWAERLLENDVYIVPITYPIVSKSSPRLRLTISIQHSYRDIDLLVSKLLRVSNKNYKQMVRKRRSSAEILQLIDRVTEEIIQEKGFSGLSIQEVCDRAEIEPSLFYRRYPEGFAYYTEKFIREHDFWLTYYKAYSAGELCGTSEELTQILYDLWRRISEDKSLESLLRLELQDSPPKVAIDIAKEREILTKDLVMLFANSFDNPEIKRIQLAIISSGVQFLALHKKVSNFCGIDFNSISNEKLKLAISQMSNCIVKKE